MHAQHLLCAWLLPLCARLPAGGPYERKYYALELLALLLEQWQPGASDADAGAAAERPLARGLLSPEAVQVLLGCLVDSWDKLRMVASR